MSEDSKALEAAKLYAEDATFQHIAETLEISKSHAQVLVRRGILLSMEEPEENIPGELTENNPVHQVAENNPIPIEMPSLPIYQDPRIGSYELQTTGIGRRVMVTAMDIMVYDLFKDGGFTGDFSSFVSDAIQFMYNNVRPAERY